MIELQFFADINYENFLEDCVSQFGVVPGTIDRPRRVLTVSMHEYGHYEGDFKEMLRDYGGQMRHRK